MWNSMPRLLLPEEMREAEKRYMAENGIRSIDLMETAAGQLVSAMLEIAPDIRGRTVCFACGPGGNGGDGCAAARLFASSFGRAAVLSPLGVEAARGDALVNLRRARETAGVAFVGMEGLDAIERPAMWVDAMFGIGLTRPLEGACARLAERMARDRAQGSRVLAVDIPSGIHGGSGRDLGGAVAADFTVTFETAKTGHYLNDGLDACGALTVRPIGLGGSVLPENAVRLIRRGDLALPRRPRNAHKGTFGHLLIVAGSLGMAGAACLCARAALRSGAGLVSVACPSPIVPILQAQAPGAMAIPLPDREGVVSPEAVPVLKQALSGKTALAVGPGLRRSAPPEIVETALRAELPAVLDADALNILADHPELLPLLGPRHVLTPHPGEAARLLGRRVEDPVRDARALGAAGCVALLKGASSVIAGRHTSVSTAGCCGMARGGSGDILTGMIGGMLAWGCPPEEAACLASEFHGMAGELAQKSLGPYAMAAEDLLTCIPAVLSQCAIR